MRDLGLGADAAEFADVVRAFVDGALADAAAHADPGDLTGLSEDFEREVSRLAGKEGLLGSGIAAEQGGPGRTGRHQAVFDFVVAAADAPLIDTALTLAGHPVLHYGSAAQRAFFLPRMVRGELLVCVAYTEEHAGSDLRALRATAVPDGEELLLTGRKTLVTGAHKADWCVTIARTGQRPGAMTMLLVELGAPGVTVTRRPTLNGWTLDEIEFDAVRLGADAVLGIPGAGWRQLVSAVQAERSGLFYLGFARHVLDLLGHQVGSRPPDPLAADALAALEVDFDAGLLLAARAVREPGPVLASMAKIFGTELLQRIAQTATELTGHAGLVHAPLFGPAPPYAAAGGRFAWEYLERVHGTIGAGTNEVLRDGLAEFGLGLPRAGARAPGSADSAGDRTPTADEPDARALTALMTADPGYDVPWWRAAMAAGRFAGGHPASYGGSGSFVDLTTAIGELAAAATPSPVHNGVVQAGSALLLVGGVADHERHLRVLLSGERRYAFCLTEADGGYEPASVRTSARAAAEGWVLDGLKCYVPYAADADVLLVVARTDEGHGLFAVDRTAAGVAIEPLPTLGWDHQCVLRLDGVRAVRIGPDRDAWPALTTVLARAAVAVSADLAGAADAALRHVVARVTTRTQRGVPLGAFQVVKHRCADLYLDVTLAAGVVRHAAELLDAPRPVGVGPDERIELSAQARRAAAVAKVLCAQRCREVSAGVQQLSGGDGIHLDRPPHLWFRRIKALEPVAGGPRFHRAALAAARADGVP